MFKVKTYIHINFLFYKRGIGIGPKRIGIGIDFVMQEEIGFGIGIGIEKKELTPTLIIT